MTFETPEVVEELLQQTHTIDGEKKTDRVREREGDSEREGEEREKEVVEELRQQTHTIDGRKKKRRRERERGS